MVLNEHRGGSSSGGASSVVSVVVVIVVIFQVGGIHIVMPTSKHTKPICNQPINMVL